MMVSKLRASNSLVCSPKIVTYPEYVVPKSTPTINRSFSGAGSLIGPAIASVDDGGV